MRIATIVAAAMLTTGGLTAAESAHASIQHYELNIPRQTLDGALKDLAQQTGLQIGRFSDTINGSAMVGPVKGNQTPEEALKVLLAPQGLSYKVVNDTMIAIINPKDNAQSTSGENSRVRGEGGNFPSAREGNGGEDSSGASDPKSFWSRLRLAQTTRVSAQSTNSVNSASASSNPSSAATSSGSSGPVTLDEVIVTATKRPEAVRKISAAVSAVTGDQLDALGAQSFADYLSRIPGVNFDAYVPGNSAVVVRGVSTTTFYDLGQGTTGYFVNDVPLTDPFFTVAIPDIDTFDVDNVTVLRGPQGTLFGSASLGGAINYQAAKPNMNDYQLHYQGTVESTHSGNTGGSGKIMVNAPIVPGVFAVRGVYLYRDDAGYIDNVGTGQQNSNKVTVRGGRVEATWQPSQATTVNVFFLQQREDTADLGYEMPNMGPLNKSTLVPEQFGYETIIDNLRLDQDLGFATLTVTATYHEKQQRFTQDLTPYLVGLLPDNVTPEAEHQRGNARGKTFEMRLASPAAGRFDYLVGLFYDDTRGGFDTTFNAPNAAAGIDTFYSSLFGAGIGEAIVGPNNAFETEHSDDRGRESAVFGEGTYHFADQWKVTLGGRFFKTKSQTQSDQAGLFPLFDGAPSEHFSGTEDDSGFTPKASITWTASTDLMVYGLVSKGFRFGGPNTHPGLVSDPVPASYHSDSLINYELGTRTNWFDRALQLDATVFYIDWSNIQLREYNSIGTSFEVNAGKARNYGFEGTSSWRIAKGLALQTNLTYLNAELAQDYVAGGSRPVIPRGTVLPGASRWQVSNTLAYSLSEVPLQPFLSVSHRYISRAPIALGTSAFDQGNYSLLDARIGCHVRSIEVAAFVDNIADARGITSGFQSGSVTQQFLVRPRTVGLTLDYRL